MKAQVIKGSKQEISRKVANLGGGSCEAIVFIAEPSGTAANTGKNGDDILAEMEPHMVNVQQVDDSRHSIYTRQDGE
jgi:hypothetical protein